MKIFREAVKIKEIPPVPSTEDNGSVITEKKNEIGESNSGRPIEKEIKPDIVKELIAHDTIQLGPRESSLLHGVSESSAKRYANAETIKDPDVKTRIIDAKHNIQDLAVTKLMETLQLLDPQSIERERDKVTIINGLSQVIERVGNSTNQKEGNKAIHLHLYNPGVNKESDYDVIEVKGT